nr:MAG TPA: hypothetical protein [Caudoviricetes sp.]
MSWRSLYSVFRRVRIHFSWRKTFWIYPST